MSGFFKQRQSSAESTLSPNAGQYGWTLYESQSVSQIIGYVNEAKGYAVEAANSAKSARESAELALVYVNQAKEWAGKAEVSYLDSKDEADRSERYANQSVDIYNAFLNVAANQRIIETFSLAANQTVVDFVKIFADAAYITVNGQRVDSAYLVKDLDYTVTAVSQITMKRRYPEGTLLSAVQDIRKDDSGPSTSDSSAIWNRQIINYLPGIVFGSYVDSGRTVSPRLVFEGKQYIPAYDTSESVTFADIPVKQNNGDLIVNTTTAGYKTFSSVKAEAVPRGEVDWFPVSISSPEFGASTAVHTNEVAINKAIAKAIASGNSVYWDKVYEVQGNLDNFHSVKHEGPGGVKRGSTTFRVNPTGTTKNTLYVSPTGTLGGDGLSSATPMRGLSGAFKALENAGSVLSGIWEISMAAGTYNDPAKITRIRSTNQIKIYGPDVNKAEPTAIIDVTGNMAGYGVWVGNDMTFRMENILIKGAKTGSGLASGIVLDAGTTGNLYNVWTRGCEQNGINANIRCRVLVEHGDYEAESTAIRVYGNSTAYIGWNQGRVTVRNAAVGVDVTGSSYSHTDYIDIVSCTYGVVSRYESHSTNYYNTFRDTSVAWEARDSSTINTNAPTFHTQPRTTKARKLFSFLGYNSELAVGNKDTRNIQYYPYSGVSGRWALGYDEITAPYKTFQFSGDGKTPVVNWSTAGGVNFAFDYASDGANYVGIGGKTSTGIAFGDETNPTRAILRHQTGGMYVRLEGTDKFRITGTTFGSYADDTMNCGTASNRIKQYYGVSGTINTSDQREKTAPIIISDEILDAWGDVKVIAFQWLESLRVKGEDTARTHYGVMAQQIRDSFLNHGIDGTQFGLLCYDEWEDTIEDGKVIPAGNRWGIRPDQCLWLEAAYQRRRCDRIEERLDKLEK